MGNEVPLVLVVDVESSMLSMRLGRKAEIWRYSKLAGNDILGDEIIRQFPPPRYSSRSSHHAMSNPSDAPERPANSADRRNTTVDFWAITSHEF